MASIIIHIDTELEEDVLDLARVVAGVAALLTNQITVRSSMHAPQELTDAAFDDRLDDVVDYANDRAKFHGASNRAIWVSADEAFDRETNTPEPQGKLVFQGAIVDTHQELPESERFVTIWGETEWFDSVKHATV